MNWLADRHHAGLYRSLQLLADRMGATLYTPVGREWATEGYWQFGFQAYGDDRLAVQYLEDHGQWETVETATRWATPAARGTIYDLSLHTFDDEFPNVPIYGVTLAGARLMDWSHVIATVQDNQQGFHRFAQEVGAQYVAQVGNTNQYVDWSLDPLALVSSEVRIGGRGVRYHQEMDPAVTVYRDPSEADPRRIASFLNCFPSIACYPIWLAAKDRLPDWTFREFGIDGLNGVLKPLTKLADEMASASFVWHDKIHGDGFGHVIHMAAAMGRPLIGHASHYRGKMAEPLWRDMETCIDLDQHDLEEVALILETAALDRVGYARMSAAIRETFDQLVDYDREAEQIRELLTTQGVAVGAAM